MEYCFQFEKNTRLNIIMFPVKDIKFPCLTQKGTNLHRNYHAQELALVCS